MQDLEELNLAELKTLAKENNIKNISKLKKDELITVLHQILQQEPRSEIAEGNSETIEDKESRIKVLEEELRLRNKIIEDYENSTSWKLTKPLRKIGTIVKK